MYIKILLQVLHNIEDISMSNFTGHKVYLKSVGANKLLPYQPFSRYQL